MIRSYRGSHLRANSVVNWFVALFQELGYEGCSSHSGRRSFINDGGPQRALVPAAACATCSCSRGTGPSKRRNATSTATPARRGDWSRTYKDAVRRRRQACLAPCIRGGV